MPKKNSELESENAALKRQLDLMEAEAKREKDKQNWLKASSRVAWGQGAYLVLALLVIFNRCNILGIEMRLQKPLRLVLPPTMNNPQEALYACFLMS